MIGKVAFCANNSAPEDMTSNGTAAHVKFEAEADEGSIERLYPYKKEGRVGF